VAGEGGGIRQKDQGKHCHSMLGEGVGGKGGCGWRVNPRTSRGGKKRTPRTKGGAASVTVKGL